MSLSIVIYSSDYLTFRTLYEANNQLCNKKMLIGREECNWCYSYPCGIHISPML